MTSHLTPFEKEQEFRKNLERLFETHIGNTNFCNAIEESYKIFCEEFHVDYKPFKQEIISEDYKDIPWDMGDDE